MIEVPALEYITADLWTEARKDWPCGRRGWFIVTEGNKYVSLFSPVLLRTFRLKVSEFDALPHDHAPFDRQRMIERIEANRETMRRYGHFDGGRAADRVLDALRAEPVFLESAEPA